MKYQELSLEEQLIRAERARQILEDDLFKEAVRAIEEALLSGIQRSAFLDAPLREKLCQRYALLGDLIGQFRTHMETGQLAAEELRQKTMRERALQVVGAFR